MLSGEAIKVFPYGWKQTNILLHFIFTSQLRKERERGGGGREEGRKEGKEKGEMHLFQDKIQTYVI